MTIKERIDDRLYIRCGYCGKMMFQYELNGDDEAIAMQSITLSCRRCNKAITFKKYTEGLLKQKAVDEVQDQKLIHTVYAGGNHRKSA